MGAPHTWNASFVCGKDNAVIESLKRKRGPEQNEITTATAVWGRRSASSTWDRHCCARPAKPQTDSPNHHPAQIRVAVCVHIFVVDIAQYCICVQSLHQKRNAPRSTEPKSACVLVFFVHVVGYSWTLVLLNNARWFVYTKWVRKAHNFLRAQRAQHTLRYVHTFHAAKLFKCADATCHSLNCGRTT